MSRIRAVLCTSMILAACLVVPGRAYQVMNLITNGSFEQRTAASGTPSGWRFYTNEGSAYTWGYTPCTGGKDMRVSRTATTGETVLDNWDHMVPITGGASYKYKFVANGSGTLNVTVGWATTNNTYSQSVYNYTLSAGYQPFYINATAPSGYAKAWIAFRLTGTGNFDVDDVGMIADPGAQQYPDAFVNPSWTYWNYSNLMEVSTVGDGVTNWSVVWDKECRNTLNNASGHYMYFQVYDTYMPPSPGGRKVAITVEYADYGTDTLSLEYDGTGGAYTLAGTVTKTSTGEWKKKTFYISDAYFANRENGGADFRINDRGDGLEYISYVAVTSWDSTIRSHARVVNNHLEVNGTPTFFKIASLAADHCNEDLSGLGYPAQYAAKSFTAAKVDNYWFHWDYTGSGSYNATTNLTNYINDCYSRGIKMAMTFETGNVGGGGTPSWLFDWYDCQAVNSLGQAVIDTDYGTNLKVQSIASDAFLNRSRSWMTWMLGQIDKTKFYWYETAVEPQYMNGQWLDYSAASCEKWRLWLAWRYTLGTLNSQWGTSYTNYDAIPMPTSSTDTKWNFWIVWRTYNLANWINGDIQTIRNVVGEEALVAVDALIVPDAQHRLGDQSRLMNQINPNVFQVNWHWYNRAAYNTGYDLCVPIARTKNQAISEHMTLNNSDFVSADVDAILRHTLTKGNKFGWDLVNMRPNTADSFSLYNDNWTAKPVINVLDSNTAAYMSLAGTYLTLPL